MTSSDRTLPKSSSSSRRVVEVYTAIPVMADDDDSSLPHHPQAACHFVSGAVWGMISALVGLTLLTRPMPFLWPADPNTPPEPATILLRWLDQQLGDVGAILSFALVWSLLTSGLAYVWLGGWRHYTQHRTSSESQEITAALLPPGAKGDADDDPTATNHHHDHDNGLDGLEYYYAMGVFLGFCATCTCADIWWGLPWNRILLTAAVALVWSLLMTWWASSARASSSTSPRRVTWFTLQDAPTAVILV